MTISRALAGVAILAGILLLVALALGKWPFPSIPSGGQPGLPREVVRVGGVALDVEIADDPSEREHGLSGRSGLATGTGMLFRFPAPAVQPFWMKDMRFPLDIVYIHEGRIREVFADVPFPPAAGTPVTVVPTGPADAVLEVPAGEAARQGWGPGTPVSDPG